MKKLILISIFVLCIFTSFSQIQLTQYFLDGTLYNPAFAGSQEDIYSNMYGRQQWIGLSDVNGNKISPLSFVINTNAPISAIHGGAGVNLIYDKTGFEQTLGIKLNYSYRIQLRELKANIGIGVGVSITNKSIDFGKLILEQPGDPLLSTTQKKNGFIPDFDLGVQYQQIKKINIGISATNLLESSVNIGNVKYGQKRMFYLTGEYYVKLSKWQNELYIVPSLLIKSNLSNIQFDICTRVEYKFIWAGASYRYQDAVSILGGFKLKGFIVGVSYDITTSKLSKGSSGSVEIFLGYSYTIQKRNSCSSWE